MVTPNISDEAKALMNFFRRMSAEGKTICGQQAGNNGEINYIHIMSGKLPALCAFDFLDTNSLDQALAWADLGGIVSFCWHWMAPKDGEHFYSDKTNFDVEKAVRSGSEEYKLVIRDIDQIAEKLKTLESARIPVLFRPLHEAEGMWFWWGRKGPELAKRLYHIIFDRYINFHKLTNLIWVWTSDTIEGKSEAWYPGNDFVDILGIDHYPKNADHGAFAEKYNFLLNMGSKEKLIAMTENSAIPDIDQMQVEGVLWSFFCTWVGPFIMDPVHNEEEFIKKVYNHKYVITLEKFPSEEIFGRKPQMPPVPKPLPVQKPIPKGYTVYEAEDATLCGVYVSRAIRGYHGEAYIGGLDNPGDYVEFEVDCSNAGRYSIMIRIVSPWGERLNNILINGSMKEILFPCYKEFDDFDLGEYRLNSGKNHIKIEEVDGWVELDCLLVKRID